MNGKLLCGAVLGVASLGVGGATPLALAGPASAATTQAFRATFVDIYSQCPTSPPTVPPPRLVFCGDGNVAGVGKATSTVTLTSIGPLNLVTDCQATTAVRTITLDDGDGSLTLNHSGTRCLTSAAADAEGAPFKVDGTFTVASGTGVFAGATGSGTAINRSAGNSQVSVISGTITVS